MKLVNYQFLLFISFNCVFAISTTGAEIVPDTTLPINSTVTQKGTITTINGGTQASGNLFHSFKSFDIPTNAEAIFNNSAVVMKKVQIEFLILLNQNAMNHLQLSKQQVGY